MDVSKVPVESDDDIAEDEEQLMKEMGLDTGHQKVNRANQKKRQKKKEKKSASAAIAAPTSTDAGGLPLTSSSSANETSSTVKSTAGGRGFSFDLLAEPQMGEGRETTEALSSAFAEVFQRFESKAPSIDARNEASAAAAYLAAREAEAAAAGGEGGAEGGGREGSQPASADAGGGENGASFDDAPRGPSRKEKKKLIQLSVATLKKSVERPEVVEVHDVTSHEPLLLVSLKAAHNTVPVPRHWCQKSRYLQRRRGFEKPAFQLPDFIASTGIGKLRGADDEANAEKTLKGRLRDRYLPKMGRIEIDIDVLHEAFFTLQKKPPRLSAHGDLYYQGRELERASKRGYKPGVRISKKLKDALEWLPGQPPPWLFKMQQYGPPPAYPHLRVAGLNSPLPIGVSYGIGEGQWGRVPVDEFGRPLYGPAFGAPTEPLEDGVEGAAADAAAAAAAAAEAGSALLVHKSFSGGGRGGKRLWGEFSDAEAALGSLKGGPLKKGASEAAAEVLNALTEAVPLSATAASSSSSSSASSASGVSAVSTAVDGTASALPRDSADDFLDLRKGGGASGAKKASTANSSASEASSEPAPELFQVLEERSTSLTGGLLGSNRLYVLPSAADASTKDASNSAASDGGGGGGSSKRASAATDGSIDLVLSPEELEKLDPMSIARKYEEQVNAAAASAPADDIAEMLAEQERKRKRKDAGGGSSVSSTANATGGAKAKKSNFKF